jgi:hypothetical protein
MFLDRDPDWLVTEKRDPGAAPCRTIFLSDSLILIAALCLALAWDRGRFSDPTRWISLSPPVLPRSVFPSTPSGWAWDLAVYAINGVELLPPFLILGSLAVLVLRLRHPSPIRRWLFWQPGLSACTVASVALAAAGLLSLAMYLLSSLSSGLSAAFLARRLQEGLMPENLTAAATVIGYGVAGTWVALAAKHRWRPEPGWIDGLGRLVGVGWIVMVIGGMILPIIHIASWSL